MAGLPRVLVHNLLLLGAIISSAIGVFVLARHLTGSAGAGLLAGIVFAFVPYRFEHYMHMEMQWTMWMPWALWALHRAFETRRAKFGLLTGFFLSLQMLSSIYYGVFLIVVIGVVALLLLLPLPLKGLARTVVALAPAAVVVAVLCGAYAIPYLETKKEVGGRAEREIMLYSARPSNYLVATPENVVYGQMFQRRGRPERRLFPGVFITVLAIFGLFMRPRASIPIVIAYLLAMVVSFEMSLGLSGYSYRFLFDYVPVFGGFRAVARLGIFVVFFLSILGAFGYAALAAGMRPWVKRLFLVFGVAVLVFEYRVAVDQPDPVSERGRRRSTPGWRSSRPVSSRHCRCRRSCPDTIRASATCRRSTGSRSSTATAASCRTRTSSGWRTSSSSPTTTRSRGCAGTTSAISSCTWSSTGRTNGSGPSRR